MHSGVKDYSTFSHLDSAISSKEKLISFLTCTASREQFDSKLCPEPLRLTRAQATVFSDSELTKIADELIGRNYFRSRFRDTREALPDMPARDLCASALDHFATLLNGRRLVIGLEAAK